MVKAYLYLYISCFVLRSVVSVPFPHMLSVLSIELCHFSVNVYPNLLSSYDSLDFLFSVHFLLFMPAIFT
jgi:hypothetical protein